MRVFSLPSGRAWMAASASIGAGRPDLVIVSFDPAVFALAAEGPSATSILAYLFSISAARAQTIALRLRASEPSITRSLRSLANSGAVDETDGRFSLSPSWRQILPEIIAIEIKVSDWQRAIQQAARNRVLAHRSFIALPPKPARRALSDARVSSFGLGVISVNDTGSVTILKPSRRSKPRVPSYYFDIARLIAVH
jgi:hypothetical protein